MRKPKEFSDLFRKYRKGTPECNVLSIFIIDIWRGPKYAPKEVIEIHLPVKLLKYECVYWANELTSICRFTYIFMYSI